MSTKTDLAKEIIDKKSFIYAKKQSFSFGGTEIFEVRIETDEDSALFGKPKGIYITVEADSIRIPLSDFFGEAFALASEIRKMIPEKGDILLVGIGNSSLTADSLGPLTAEMIPCGEFSGRKLFAFSPGTFGKTHIEPEIFIFAAIEKLRPAAVIFIDALAAEDISHICRTIQLTDSGISPGSGVGRAKAPLNKENLGVPAIAIGTPTVIRYPDSDSVFVSPNDIDILIKKAARLIAFAAVLAVFPSLDSKTVSEMIL